MTAIWLIYIVVAAVSGIFFILYKDILSLVLFCVIIALPILLLIFTLITRFCTKIKISIDPPVTSSDADITVSVSNRSPFSISAIILKFDIFNTFLKVNHKCEFSLSCDPFCNKDFVYKLTSDHVGNLDIKIKKAYICDYFHMFRIPIKLNVRETVTFIPEPDAIDIAVRPNNFAEGESNIFSKHKPGDDPSEVFDVREYVGGDKINRMHWKLSAKTDLLMIKDYSLPISQSVLLLFDTYIGDNAHDAPYLIDDAVKALFDISYDMIQKSIYHKICFYDNTKADFTLVDVTTEDDLYTAMGRLLSVGMCNEYHDVFVSDALRKKFVSNIVLVTAGLSTDAQNSVVNNDSQGILCSVVKVDEKEQYSIEPNGVCIVCVKKNEIANGLIRVIL